MGIWHWFRPGRIGLAAPQARGTDSSLLVSELGGEPGGVSVPYTYHLTTRYDTPTSSNIYHVQSTKFTLRLLQHARTLSCAATRARCNNGITVLLMYQTVLIFFLPSRELCSSITVGSRFARCWERIVTVLSLLYVFEYFKVTRKLDILRYSFHFNKRVFGFNHYFAIRNCTNSKIMI